MNSSCEGHRYLLLKGWWPVKGWGHVLRTRLVGLVACGAVVAAALVNTALGAAPATAARSATALSATGPAPGTIFVANGGRNSAGGTGNGSVTAYRPGVTGDARPSVVLTDGIKGPGSLVFDSSGDL